MTEWKIPTAKDYDDHQETCGYCGQCYDEGLKFAKKIAMLLSETKAKHCDSDGYFGYKEACRDFIEQLDKLI